MKQSEEKLWAVGSHLGSLVFGPLVGLVVYLVFKDRSRYIGHHAYQAMWFFFTTWIVILVLRFLGPLAILAYPVGIAALCMAVVASMNALAGRWFEYPVIGRIWHRALGN